MKQIELTKGKFAIVDDEDYEALILTSWYANPKTGSKQGKYAARGEINGRRIYMHTFIFELRNGVVPCDMMIDHVNGETLDNRKENLRICSKKNNGGNVGKVSDKTSSKYKCVCLYKGKWMVQVAGKYGGLFSSEVLAAETANKMMLEEYGEFAKLNVIEYYNA